MALSVIKPANSIKPNFLIGENYERTLKQSIQMLLAEIRGVTPNFDDFIHTFYELMQAKIDPPLESIWVHSALVLRSRNSTNNDASNRLSVAKDLFQLVSACSASCGSSKSIALLAPVILEVYKFVVELFGKDLVSKKEKKIMKGTTSLIEEILAYISMCCCKDLDEESDSDTRPLNLIVPLVDLVCVWMGENEGIESFLPLVVGEICQEISVGGCVVNHLAGIIISEAFLLKMCLNFRVGIARAELEKNLRSWTVASITGFQNFYFFETLVRMLLETTLPVTTLLSSEDLVLVRKVLYDAVILVEYSFLRPEREMQLPANHVRSLAMKRLIVTHEAIEFFRKNGDHTRAISYISAFSSSHLPSQIIKWATSQIRTEEKVNRSNGSSPRALIKWLLNLEGQGIRIFDDSISKCRVKLLDDISKADYEQSACKKGSKNAHDNILFYIDKKGEGEDGNEGSKEADESMGVVFVAAANTMKSTKHGRKRKEGKSVEKKKIKYRKFDLSENSDSARERLPFVSKDCSSSETEVENRVSDEDAEIEEQ